MNENLSLHRSRNLLRIILASCLFMSFSFTLLLAQEITVSGTVSNSEDGSPLPGVNVHISGTSTGSITSIDGQYTLTVPGAGTNLVFSFVGFLTKEVRVGNQTVINVAMSPDSTHLSDIVVTALGVERDKREIPYAAQNVETANFSRARELNVVNSLQGRVAGMDLIRSSSGLGSATRVVLRGNRSIAGNNQPLYIVDGVPIQNGTWSILPYYRYIQYYWSSPDSENGGLQGGDGISNINPDDIVSITVLKSPNAAALYGSRAANGAIVITTRKGVAGRGIGVEFNTNSSIDKALILTRYQHVYGQGWDGVYYPYSEISWGLKWMGRW